MLGNHAPYRVFVCLYVKRQGFLISDSLVAKTRILLFHLDNSRDEFRRRAFRPGKRPISFRRKQLPVPALHEQSMEVQDRGRL
jgi:hypothetical protein